ncbi:MAG: hypothetical protein IKM81_05405 [Fibrobacter sp.]|nr:hypothetical protein [Fibrobacter sp.]
MATYENNDYASKGVGTAGLTLGVIGTALASGGRNGNGLGGLFGNQNPATSPVYQLAQKDNEIALLKAQQYSDNKIAVLTERVSNLEARVLADEKTDPLRDQILGDRIAGLQNIVNRISAPFVPNYAVAPGWGPAFVSPFPPAPPVAAGSGTVTPATSSSGTSQAA